MATQNEQSAFGGLKSVRFEIMQFGELGILQHNPEKLMKPADAEATISKKAKIPTPDEEAELGTYRLPSGGLYFPTAGFFNGILKAASGQKIEKKSAMSILAAALFTTAEHTPLICPQTGDPIKDYEVDVRRVVINRTAAVMRGRAHIRPWCAHVEFLYEPLLLNPGILTSVFSLAGLIAGVGDYRPEKKGPFGRYSVKLVE